MEDLSRTSGQIILALSKADIVGIEIDKAEVSWILKTKAWLMSELGRKRDP